MPSIEARRTGAQVFLTTSLAGLEDDMLTIEKDIADFLVSLRSATAPE